jgi:phosphoribosylaminoimidazolecarboxamide formyltransferase/IMP cyclohydrolase
LSWYDSQIAGFLSTNGGNADLRSLPEYFSIAGVKLQDVRYGENPHQEAALYISQPTSSPLQHLKKHAGRDLSLLNVTDINAGLESVRMFTEPAAVVIKHNSPCGIALGKTAGEALQRAIEADPVSAFGGVIVTNKPIDKKTATIISSFKEAKRGNIDIVAAPAIADDALKLLSSIRKTMGIYTFDEIPKLRKPAVNVKWIDGGFFVQDADDGIDESFSNWKVVTKKKPTQKQIKQMQVAWKFVTRIKSNAVIVVDKTIPMTRGIGAGQTSRVGATQLSLELSGDYSKGAILAGDSFFPFGDSVTLAAEHGIAAIVQQGGSINDQSSIDAANEAGIPMVFTGRRAFWH